MSAKHTPMVVAAARVLAQRAAAQCNVDAEDNWKVYGEDYLQEAEAALNAAGAPELLAALSGHRWPGNLRQLDNALRTACALLGDGEVLIDWQHLPDDLASDLRIASGQRDGAADPADLRAVAQHAVQEIVDSCGGNLSEAARRLGISRNTLYRKLREMGQHGLPGRPPVRAFAHLLES